MDNTEMFDQDQPVSQEKVAPVQVPRRKRRIKAFLEWVLQMMIVALIVVLLNIFVCRLVRVSGDSMYPTLYDNDYLMIRILAYDPDVNDIVVCKTDENSSMGGKQIVKRCIATAGQTVFVDYANNTVAVDGVVLDETYINQDEEDPLVAGGRENAFYLVPEGHIFVLGDNRNHSADSRDSTIGLVSLDDVIGGMMFRFPLGMWITS